ncbi:type I secretion system permease/ATPase [Tsuneonella sp. HG222]
MSVGKYFEERRPRLATWLAEPMMRNKAVFIRVAIAAVMINLFAYVISMFTLVVYDRVVPNLAFDSLTVLAIGLAVVLVFDFILRILRAYFVDIAGADMDRDIGARFFDKIVEIRMAARRGSTGQLAGLMRELETLRDFFASATLISIVDVPFVILTLAIIAMIGSWTVVVPLVLIPITIAAGLLSQPALDRLSSRTMEGGLGKQTVLVEMIGAMEMVKTAGAQRLLRERWMKAVDSQSSASVRQRLVSNIAVTVAASASSLSYAGVVIVGVFLIANQTITMGGLIAASILSSRAIQPLGQIASMLTRFAMTRTAYRQLDRLMEDSVEGGGEGALKPSEFKGRIDLRGVAFKYPGSPERSLENLSLSIAPGEKVGIIGRVGSGKSTVTRLILGLYEPEEGVVLLDGTDVRQLDPVNMRRQIGTALQEPVLLSGSVRENITLDRPGIDDDEMLRASELAGSHAFMGRLANGYDLILADRGEGLSGGQRQAISLARALAGKPQILIFDEPTSAMDAQSEQQLIDRLKAEVADRTLIIVSHRINLLQLVERLIVIENGRIVQDGPRDQVLQALQGPRKAA